MTAANDIRLRFITQLEGAGSAGQGLKGVNDAFTGAAQSAQRFAQSVANAGNQVAQSMGNTAQRAVKQVETGLQSIVRMSNEAGLAMAGLSAALGIGTGVALKNAVEYETAMNRVKAVINDASEGAMAQLIEKTRELGTTTTFSMTQAAQGMEFLAKAGYKTAQILETVPTVLKLAAVEGRPAGQTSEDLVRILNSFGLAADQAARAGDVLAKIANESTTSMSGLVEAMKFAAPIAAGLGMQIEETAAYIGVLADRGIDASMAGTAVRRMMERLSDPTKEARNVLAELGVEIARNDDKSLNLTETFKRLNAANLTVAQSFQLFGTYGATAGVILARDIGKVEEFTQKANDAGGSLQQMYSTVTSGLGPQMEILKNSVMTFVVTALTPMLKSLTVLVTWFASATKALADFSAAHPVFAAALGVAGSALTLLIGLFTLVGPVVAAIIALWRVGGVALETLSVNIFGSESAITKWIVSKKISTQETLKGTAATQADTASMIANTAAVVANAEARRTAAVASAVPVSRGVPTTGKPGAAPVPKTPGGTFEGSYVAPLLQGMVGGPATQAAQAGKQAGVALGEAAAQGSRFLGVLSNIVSKFAIFGSFIAIGEGLSNIFSSASTGVQQFTGVVQLAAGALMLFGGPVTAGIGIALLVLTQFGDKLRWVAEQLGLVSPAAKQTSNELVETVGNWVKEGKGSLDDFTKQYQQAYGKDIPKEVAESFKLQTDLKKAAAEQDKTRQQEMIQDSIKTYAAMGKTVEEFSSAYQKQFGSPPDALIKGAYERIKKESKSTADESSKHIDEMNQDFSRHFIELGFATGESYRDMFQKAVTEWRRLGGSLKDQPQFLDSFNKVYNDVVVKTKKAVSDVGKEWTEAGVSAPKELDKSLDQLIAETKQRYETELLLLEQNQNARSRFLDFGVAEQKAAAAESIASEQRREAEVSRINASALETRLQNASLFAKERVAKLTEAFEAEKALLLKQMENDSERAEAKKKLTALEEEYARNVAKAEGDSAKQIGDIYQQLLEKRAEYAAQIKKLEQEIWDLQRRGIEVLRSVDMAAASEYETLKMKLEDARAKLKQAAELMPEFPEMAKALAQEAQQAYAALAQSVDAAVQQIKSDTELIYQSFLKIQQVGLSPFAKWRSDIEELNRLMTKAFSELAEGRIKEARAIFQEIIRKAPEVAQQAPAGRGMEGKKIAEDFVSRAGRALSDLNAKDIEDRKRINDEAKKGIEESTKIQADLLETQKTSIDALKANTEALLALTQATLAGKGLTSEQVQGGPQTAGQSISEMGPGFKGWGLEPGASTQLPGVAGIQAATQKISEAYASALTSVASAFEKQLGGAISQMTSKLADSAVLLSGPEPEYEGLKTASSTFMLGIDVLNNQIAEAAKSISDSAAIQKEATEAWRKAKLTVQVDATRSGGTTTDLLG